jgi:hypothetical protein
MATKTKAKTFDCVEMKDRIQAEIVAEYERRKAEFPSFYDFIRAENDKSDWVRRMRAKFGWS